MPAGLQALLKERELIVQESPMILQTPNSILPFQSCRIEHSIDMWATGYLESPCGGRALQGSARVRLPVIRYPAHEHHR